MFRPPLKEVDGAPHESGRKARRARRNVRRAARRRANRARKKARKRAGLQWERPTNGNQCLADCVRNDLTIDVRHQRFFDSSENTRVGRIARLPLQYTRGYFKIGIYSANTLTYVRSRKMSSCTNKMAKFFGIDPKKDRHWAALLRCLVCTGMNPSDFRSVMRIRDLRVRGKYRTYRHALTSFIAQLPTAHVRRALPESCEGLGRWGTLW